MGVILQVNSQPPIKYEWFHNVIELQDPFGLDNVSHDLHLYWRTALGLQTPMTVYTGLYENQPESKRAKRIRETRERKILKRLKIPSMQTQLKKFN